MGKPLTIDLIVQKTKNDQLSTLKNLNLWGNDIDDLKVLRQLPNLEVLSLSVNKITTLKDISVCHKLQELYLRKNLISDLRELKHLVHLPNLKVLWLQDNPCADHVNYREIVIKYLPNLVKLDNTTINPEDRASAQNYKILEEDNTEDFLEAPPQINNNFLNKPKASMKDSPTKKFTQNAKVFQQAEQKQAPAVETGAASRISEKNENILCAVLALIKELDENSLEIVRRDIDRKLSKTYNLKRVL